MLLAESVKERIMSELHPKERVVLLAFSDGDSNKTIADKLCTTEQVIKNYMRRIFDVFGVETRITLFIACLRLGVFPCPCSCHKEEV